MAKNNVKLGYCYSVALHVLVAIAMFAYALIDLLFPKEVIENKLVFEMVEPTQTKEVLPPPPPQQCLPTDWRESIQVALAGVGQMRIRSSMRSSCLFQTPPHRCLELYCPIR